MKLSRFEKYIAIGLVLLICGLSWMLQEDRFWSDSSVAGGEALGQLTDVKNDVRTKSSSSFSWSPATLKDQVYWNQSLYTGPKSETTVKLLNGALLKLGANTFIRFTQQNGLTKLNLSQGSVVAESGDSKNDILIENEGETIAISSQAKTALKIVKEKSKPFAIAKSKGQVEVKNLETQAPVKIQEVKSLAELIAPSDVASNSLTAPELEEPTTLLAEIQPSIAPENVPPAPPPSLNNFASETSTLFANEELKVSWQSTHSGKYQANWTWNDKDESQIVETATISIPLSEDSESDSKPVRNTSLDVKIWPLDASDSTMGDPQLASLSWQWEPAPQPSAAPAELNRTMYIEDFDAWNAKIKVSANSRRQTHIEYQLSPDPDFKTIQKSDVLPLTNREATIEVSQLPAGTWHLRVRGGLAPQLHTFWSRPLKWQLQVKKPLVLTAPVLQEHNIAYSVDSTPPVINWESGPADKYTFEFAKDPEFNVNKRTITEEKKIISPKFPPGVYYYRVYAMKNDKMSPPSETGTILTQHARPILKVSPNKAIKTDRAIASLPAEKVEIEWQHSSESVQLWQSSDPEFSAPTKTELKTKKHTVKIQTPGKYFFQLHCPKQGEQELCLPSKVQTWTYDVSPGLHAPKITNPVNDMIIYTSANKGGLPVEWTSDTKAIGYEVELSRDESFGKETKKIKSRRPSSLFASSLGTGTFYLRVKAVSDNSLYTSDWSKPVRVQIKTRAQYFTK